MVRFGTQLALTTNGFVVAGSSTKNDGPFSCKICSKELKLRAGKKQPAHFIHQAKSGCEGNTDEDRSTAKIMTEEPNVVVPEEPKVQEVVPEEPKVQEVVPEEPTQKCTNCKKFSNDCSKLFSDNIIKTLQLNDLHICPSCTVSCDKCNGINSLKNEKRYGSCFECEDVRSDWESSAVEALENLDHDIPQSPSWLNNEYEKFSINLRIRRSMAKRIYQFMFKIRKSLSTYSITMKSVVEKRHLLEHIRKMRKEDEKNKKRRQGSRDRVNGPVATDRYNKMFMNKKETCNGCGSHGKRRQFTKYDSTMGSIRWSCPKCIKTCPCCKEPTIDRDMDMYSQTCFECETWTTSEKKWKNNYLDVLKGASSGDKESVYILFRNSPIVEKGKFSGERISNLSDSEIESIGRRTPTLANICKAIIVCRRK